MTLAFEMNRQRAEGRVETVVGMLQENLSIDMIARIIKLTVEQIIEIGKKNSLI